MLKKLFKGIFTVVGILVGFGASDLVWRIYAEMDPESSQALAAGEKLWLQIFIALIFGIIFYKLAPVLNRKSKKMADNIGNDLQAVSASDLVGGTPAENAAITRAILSGEERGAKRQAVCLNAGAALYIGGKAATMAEGVRMAEGILDSGAALAKLEAVIRRTGGVTAMAATILDTIAAHARERVAADKASIPPGGHGGHGPARPARLRRRL